MSHRNPAYQTDEEAKNSHLYKTTENPNQHLPGVYDNGLPSVSKKSTSTDIEPVRAPRQNSPPHVNFTQSQPAEAPPREIFFYIQVAFFAICGCLTRIGIDRCFGTLAKIEDPGEIVNQSFFSNIFGCFVLGALNGSPMGSTKLATLYKGLTTGFCGSFTTWSKWNQQLSMTLIGETDTGGAQKQVLSIASWFIGFYTYLGSYQVGMDFGKSVGKLFGDRVTRNGPWISDRVISALLAIAFIGFIIAVIVDPSQTSKGIWMAVLFAPFGACLRLFLSKYKLDRFMFPTGTFVANTLGAVILAAMHVVGTRVTSNCKDDVCWGSIVVYGVGTGFCACLTTISTFMSEIYKIRPKNPVFGYGYPILTVVVCQTLCGIINGVNFASK